MRRLTAIALALALAVPAATTVTSREDHVLLQIAHDTPVDLTLPADVTWITEE